MTGWEGRLGVKASLLGLCYLAGMSAFAQNPETEFRCMISGFEKKQSIYVEPRHGLWTYYEGTLDIGKNRTLVISWVGKPERSYSLQVVWKDPVTNVTARKIVSRARTIPATELTLMYEEADEELLISCNKWSGSDGE